MPYLTTSVPVHQCTLFSILISPYYSLHVHFPCSISLCPNFIIPSIHDSPLSISVPDTFCSPYSKVHILYSLLHSCSVFIPPHCTWYFIHHSLLFSVLHFHLHLPFLSPYFIARLCFILHTTETMLQPHIPLSLWHTAFSIHSAFSPLHIALAILNSPSSVLYCAHHSPFSISILHSPFYIPLR